MMRIVIVEDHPITRNVLALALEAIPDCQVLSFPTAQEGLTACAEGAELAIFDNQLPDMTGTAAVALLRNLAATRHLPVIVITGDGDRQTRMAAISAGATDFLEKPVQIDELRIRVRNLLALSAAEKEARSGQALLETLIAGADARVIVADARQGGAPILYASDPVQRRFGANGGALQGMGLRELWARTAASAARDALDQAVDTLSAGEFVLTDPLGNGGDWVEIALSPVAEASGAVRYLIASMRDVTDLVETRQAHAQLSSRLQDIAQLSGAWFFELDDALRLSYVSAAMAQALGGDPEALVGLSVAMLPVRLADAARKHLRAEQLFAAPHAPIEQEMVTFRLPDGQIRAVQINASPFQDENGRFAGYRGHASDVSDIIRARDQAAQASRAKSVFLATMSHEMRTPLTAIVGLAELAETDLRPAGLKAHLADIRAQALQLSLLLSDVLDVAAMDQGHPVLDLAPFDPAFVLETAVGAARQTAADKGIVLDMQLLAPRPMARLGDAGRVGAILRALISNAVKFTQEGRAGVTLDLSDPASVTLTVTDTGIGMTEAEQAAAVLPFVQCDDGIARRFEGAGLGLSIVTWLTEAMGGRFALTSTPGQGTRVSISLPLPEVPHPVAARVEPCNATGPEQPAPLRRTTPPTDHPGGIVNDPATPPRPLQATQADALLDGQRVLVADDNLANRKILQTMLGRMGAKVTLCRDGAEALEAWQSDRFDIILLDINMPRMAGTEVMQAIRSQEAARRTAPVPALAVTANARPDQVAQYRSIGFDGCVAKPFTSAQLADRLAQHVQVPGT
ncbi:MAG: response regulator [Pararhodobacter sp.]|nr:response regulator [Pararhodobacter sp.]